MPGSRKRQNAKRAEEAAPADCRLFTMKDVARLLRVSVRSVRRMKKTGVLPPAIEIGRSSYWKATVIEQWIDDGCPTPS